MCILCVIQKWSRRVAAMLPWLVIPLIGLWILSQLLPPGFRFEVTSPRLACVSVLLVTLCWYEVLMPRLSAWRVRREADKREKKRLAALEMQKLKKMATRRCRNCFSPYRDQNPGGGRFMCTYCGHISKRPVLDVTGSGADSGLVGEVIGGKGNACLRPSWFCTDGWICDGNGSSPGKLNYRRKNGNGVSTRVTSMDDASLDGEKNGGLSRGENGVDFPESRGEKARRKAEEKKQARLEKELLEEEERKQREEVARLVAQQRKLRDEKIKAEKKYIKSSAPESEKNSKRKAQRKHHEGRKEKDKGSSKSNSDSEEIERKASKESEKKLQFDKRSATERRGLQKAAIESARAHHSDMKHGANVSSTYSFSGGNTSRYLDRMKGSFLSSSKTSNGGSLFGKGAHASANIIQKSSRQNHIQNCVSWGSVHSNEHLPVKLSSNGHDKISQTSLQQSVASESQQRTTPKKSWQQLFTRSPAVPPLSNSNFVNSLSQKSEPEIQSSYSPVQASSPHPIGEQISNGQSLPFCLSPYSNGSRSVSPISSSGAESHFPLVGELSYDFQSEDSDIYEDPCYVPDPLSLLGPVSESLDNFPLDLGIVNDTEPRNHALNNVCAPVEVNKPSPIEAPASRFRFVEGGNANSCSFPSSPKTHNVSFSPLNELSNAYERGIWQMWDTPQLGHDGIGLVGGTASWNLPSTKKIMNQEDFVHPSLPPGSGSPQKLCVENCQNDGAFSPFGPGSNEYGLLLENSIFRPLLGDAENNFTPLVPRQDVSQSEVHYGNMKASLPSHPFELSPTKVDWVACGRKEGETGVARPYIGGLFSTPDVQSLWSFT